LRSKYVKGQGHWERKMFFARIFVKSESIYVKSKPVISSNTFHLRKRAFCDICLSVCLPVTYLHSLRIGTS